MDAARRAAHAVLRQRYAEEAVWKGNRRNAASDASYKFKNVAASYFLLSPIFLHIITTFLESVFPLLVCSREQSKWF